MSKDELNYIFSDNLNYWLSERGKTQADLAKYLTVSTATASDWCNGKKMPRTDKLVAISKWLMIELSDLVEKKEKIEISEFDKILYKLKDDEHFYQLIASIYSFDEVKINKVTDYINLLSK